jgi:hypothetical protein
MLHIFFRLRQIRSVFLCSIEPSALGALLIRMVYHFKYRCDSFESKMTAVTDDSPSLKTSIS